MGTSDYFRITLSVQFLMRHICTGQVKAVNCLILWMLLTENAGPTQRALASAPHSAVHIQLFILIEEEDNDLVKQCAMKTSGYAEKI